jgi:hypothetical protein
LKTTNALESIHARVESRIALTRQIEGMKKSAA